MRTELFTDAGGVEIINIFNEDGSLTSMVKSIYDEMQNEAASK